MKRIFLASALAAVAAMSTAVFAQQANPGQTASPPAQSPRIEDRSNMLDAVVVSGRVAGPGFWQVYKDDNHDLWIMGTLKPLPANIQWDSTAVRALVAGANEVLWAPSYSVNVKANIFQQAMLGVGYWKAQKNPEGKSLKEVLPPALYARWLAVKSKYMPRNSSVERKRPLVAAQQLFDAAIEVAELSDKPLVYPALKATIDAAGTRSTYPSFEVNVTNATAKAALSDVRRVSLDDAKCMEATLDAVENDVPRMVANANAWARGEVAGINFAALARRDAVCSDALMNADFSEKYGLPNIQKSVADLWLKRAESALSRNTVTVAFVPMEQLVGPNNYLERLRAMGYTVNNP